MLIVGLPLIGVGLSTLLITNYIMVREHKAFVGYLELKVMMVIAILRNNYLYQVEQYMAQHKKNIQSIPPDDPLQDI